MQKSVEKIPSRRLGGGSASLGGMLAGLIGVVILSSPPSWDGPWTAWLGFLYVSLGSQFLGFFFWNRGMALAGVAKTGQLQLLQPFVTLAAAALLLGEEVGWRHAGFALAIIGIVILGRQLRVERPARS